MNTDINQEQKEQENGVSRRYNDILHRLVIDRYKHISRFAEKVGVSRSYISQIIHGHREPTVKEKIKIAKELGVDSLTIWSGKDEKR